MAARILDGAAVAKQIRSELSSRAAAFTRSVGRQPALQIVLVGDKADSQIYVNSKLKSAADEGMKATLSHLPATASLGEILRLVETLNADPAIDGILVQAPLPSRSAARLSSRCSTRSIPQKTSMGSRRSMSAVWCKTARRWLPARRRASSSCSSEPDRHRR